MKNFLLGISAVVNAALFITLSYAASELTDRKEECSKIERELNSFRVNELRAKGYSNIEISKLLGIPESSIRSLDE